MRQLLTILSLLIFWVVLCISCKNYSNTPNQQTATDSLVNSSGASVTEDYRNGARLVASNDCLTCHAINSKNVGPSFAAIAEKYHGDEKLADYLSQSVLRGSKGVWGNTEMPAHPNVQFDDIKQMAQYILSVKQ